MEDIISINLINTYRRITSLNYKKFCETEKKLTDLERPESWVMGKDKERFQDALWLKRYEFSVITIIFSVLSVEAFCNDYIVTTLGKDYMEQLDKLDIKNKLLLGIRLSTGKEFPKDKEAYCQLTNLVSLRNKLVHAKTKITTVKELIEKSKIDDYYVNIDKNLVVKATQIYELLVNEVKSLDENINSKYLIKTEELTDYFYESI